MQRLPAVGTFEKSGKVSGLVHLLQKGALESNFDNEGACLWARVGPRDLCSMCRRCWVPRS
jgi:hypothetical protein